MCNVSRSSLSVLSINSAHRSSAVRPIVTLVPPSLLVRSSSVSGGGGGQGFVVTAASDSLGAGRERFVPAADEPDPALHQLNRRRTATISSSRPPHFLDPIYPSSDRAHLFLFFHGLFN
ncbi:hypothetical protein BHE74_00009071 [Ensete ventricosum]|nr:hypothetical protein GW17_00025324 [Ensete ventricosum]RWW82454.1 hypothetical protein BHE74_00009071 [Ensete ventricosum]RZR87894.1 hypothetical protein BHM03_00015373 [Ensete ventricosum]